MTVEHVGVADAERRFAELADRVGHGESFVVLNRGQPVLALVPPQRIAEGAGEPPLGLAAFAAALDGEWDTVEDDMAAIVAGRSEVIDRPAPTQRFSTTTSSMPSPAGRLKPSTWA